MTRALLTSAAAVLTALSVQGVTPESGGNPYHGIIDRNVFALKDMPPPPPPPNPDANKPPPPPITLVGITTLLGTKRAFLSLQLPAKPPEPAKPVSLMLSEGQRDGEVEVIEINENEKTVLVSNYGSKTNLSFEKNGTASKSSGTSGSGNSGVAVNTGSHAFSPGGFSPGGANPNAARTIPTRMVRLPGANAGNPEPSGSSTPMFTPGSPSMSVNGTSLSFTPGSQPPPTPQQNQGQLTPLQQETLIEAAHQQALANGSSDAAIYPPTYANPDRNVVKDPQATDPNAKAPFVPGKPGVRPY